MGNGRGRAFMKIENVSRLSDEADPQIEQVKVRSKGQIGSTFNNEFLSENVYNEPKDRAAAEGRPLINKGAMAL